MKFEIDQASLLEALSVAGMVVDNAPIQPIMAHHRIVADERGLWVMGTNLATSIIVVVDANVIEHGEVALHAKRFQQIINSAPRQEQPITIDVDKKYSAQYELGITRGTLKGISSSDFPALNLPEGADLTVKANRLHDAINRALVSCKAENTGRPELECLHLIIRDDMLYIEAGDGHRASIEAVPVTIHNLPDNDVLVPGASMSILRNILRRMNDGDVQIAFPSETEVKKGRNRKSTSQIVFSVGSVVFMSQTMDKKFPEISRLLPQSFNIEALYQVDDLTAACRMAEIYSRDSAYSTLFKIEDAVDGDTSPWRNCSMQGLSELQGHASSDFQGEVTGTGISLYVDVRFLMHIFKPIGAPMMQIRFVANNAPIVIRPYLPTNLASEDENSYEPDFQYILMGMASPIVGEKIGKPDNPTESYYED